MAQGRVTDFFAQKKRNASAHPSKRRKVEITTGELSSELDITNAIQNRKGLDFSDETSTFPTENKKENAVFSPLQTRAARKAKATPGAKSTTRARKTAVDSKQKLIAAAFSEAVSKSAPALKVVDSVTSSWDDHDGPTTPNKPTESSALKSRKRTRGQKTDTKEQQPTDVTPEKRKPVEAPKQSETKARKKLQLKSKPEKTEAIKENEPSTEEPVPAKTVPTAPEPTETKKTKPVKMSANVEAALKKCKAMKEKTKAKAAPKLTSEEVKAKLAKTGKLEELKEQLAQLKDTRTKVKAAEKTKLKLRAEEGKGAAPSLQKFDKLNVEVPAEAKKTVPAYERFHHLAESSAPTLGLPFKYRFLAEQFRGMDTVVSMLHNRNEVCTFSKLRTAVQEFTKRNFEKKQVGQIQTVYPTAYELRQEKGISTVQGFKDPKYQLTVTPNLDETASNPSKRVHTTFKASHLLSRRERFHNGLIHIVKQHHKEFLSKLTKPLTIPDDKITRWHPKFPLDEVPDVEESPLPCPPDVQVLQSARDVLENTRGRLMPQVQSALEKTAKEVEKKSNSSKPLPTSTASPTTKPSPAPAAAPAPTKGFQSLLERVRAREAEKTAVEMTRNPKEEKRIVMMKRLPNIMRIVRSQFVTEKKPALLLDMVVQKVLDSYRSCIAPGDIEPHLQLCMEIVPEWMSQVQIKKGRYLKIDKNLELQTLTDKVENLAKGGANIKT